MSHFNVDVGAHAFDTTPNALPAPSCFKCKETEVMATQAHDEAIAWACPACRTEGRVFSWQGSLPDLRVRPPACG